MNNNIKNTFYFSGYGHSSGKFKISNKDIFSAIEKSYLGGFSESKILASKNYDEYKKQNPNINAFEYFAGHKMGFHNRHHVTPFPPTRKKLYYAETSLDLAVTAVKNAIHDSGVHPENFGAWFLSTVSPHEQAPGMAASLKAHFVRFKNQTPTFTLASGCAGFNENLERAKEYLIEHTEIKHVIIVHAETMSAFLTNRVKFVPFVTFGDAASAIVLTREDLPQNQGLQKLVNFQDQKMLDFVGVDKNWNLYMDDSVIKDRAIVNIQIAARKALELSNWSVDEIDWFIPHQTGNAILLPSADELGIPHNKIFLEEQHEYGNTSGATVAISLSMLNSLNKLKPGAKILSAMAGVGGNYGAFTYVVPEKIKSNSKNVYSSDLSGKTVLVTGASGYLGNAVSIKLLQYGADCILHYNKNIPIIPDELKPKVNFIKADFCNKTEINGLIKYIEKHDVDYYVNLAASLTNHLKVNFLTPFDIIKTLMLKQPECIVNLGHAAEDTLIPDLKDYLGSISAFHGILASASGEFFSNKVRLVYYMPSIMAGGISSETDAKQIFKFMMSVGQEEALDVSITAEKIVKSLYIPKVENVQNSYENLMIVRRDGYKMEVDI
jgi:3-oxoacyl-[acyl-carrier-protein] synthase III